MSAPSRADCDGRPTACHPRRPRSACGGAPQAHLRHTDVRTVARSRTRVEHRGLIVPTRRVGNAREPRRRTGGTRRGRLGRQAEMPEDPVDHGRLLDERDQTQAAARPASGVPRSSCRTRLHSISRSATPCRAMTRRLRAQHSRPGRWTTSDGPETSVAQHPRVPAAPSLRGGVAEAACPALSWRGSRTEPAATKFATGSELDAVTSTPLSRRRGRPREC